MQKTLSSKSLRSTAQRALIVLSAAYLTGCASLQEEFAATEAAKLMASSAPPVKAAGPKLPDLPNDIRICLMRQACQPEKTAKAKTSKAVAKANAAASAASKAECQTDDGLVLEYVQTDAEKRACAAAMVRWYRKQQEIMAGASDKAEAPKKHPQSGRPPKEAGWP